MTEEAWLTCSDSIIMIQWYGTQQYSQRKSTLFDVACCRRQWQHFTDPRSRLAVEMSERHIDGDATGSERQVAYAALVLARGEVFNERRQRGFPVGFQNDPRVHSTGAAQVAAARGDADYWYKFGGSAQIIHRLFNDPSSGQTAQAVLLRCIIGNPFRPVAFAPEWRTTIAVGIAAQMYESREFGNLPVLADALEEAGCDQSAVLAHCRERGEHARGCWVVDGVLGKTP